MKIIFDLTKNTCNAKRIVMLPRKRFDAQNGEFDNKQYSERCDRVFRRRKG